MDDNKLNLHRKTWDKICNFRHSKIELEFKISTYQKDAIDKINLLNNLIRDKKDKFTLFEHFKTSITKLEYQNLHYGDNPEV